MTNANCLQSVRCPKCGHEEDFHIEAIVRLHVIDSGTEDLGGDHVWNDDSDCTCGNRDCDQQGPLREFRIENQTGKGGAA